MGVRLVQPISGVNASASLAYGSNVTRGSLLVCAVVGPALPTLPTDTIGNTWALAVQSGGGQSATIYYVLSNKATGPNTVNVTTASDSVFLWEVAAGISSVPGSATAVLDKTSSANNSNTAVDPGAVRPTFVNSFLVSCAVVSGLPATISAGAAGWAATDIVNTNWVETLIPSGPTASQDGTFTAGGSSPVWNAACASFGFAAVAKGVIRSRAKPFLV